MTATAANILTGKTAYVAGAKVTGTMTDNSSKTSTSSYITGTFKSGTTGYVFATGTAGYYSANTYIRVPVTNLKAANIKSGVTIGGVAGTYTVAETPATSSLTVSITNYSDSGYSDGMCAIIETLTGSQTITSFPSTVTVMGVFKIKVYNTVSVSSSVATQSFAGGTNCKILCSVTSSGTTTTTSSGTIGSSASSATQYICRCTGSTSTIIITIIPST